MPDTPAENIRKDIKAAQPFLDALGVFAQIAQLGLGFENKGVAIGRTVSGKKVTYVVAQNVKLTESIVKEVEEASTDDEKIEVLVEHGVLLKINSEM